MVLSVAPLTMRPQRVLPFVVCLVGLVVAVPIPRSADNPTFMIESDSFVRDGKPMQIIAGEVHYNRIPRPLWRDRLTRVAAMGFNAIQTYVPWNFHEEQKGEYDFLGDRDLANFLGIAHDLQLLVLLRPGPYICGEWDFGGLPAFLLAEEGLVLRTYEEKYIKHVTEWMAVLLPLIRPLLYENGGPIVMVQVENEFGSYGNVNTSSADRKYMQYLTLLFRKHLGHQVILYTTDGGNLGMMTRGSLKDELFTVGDFGPGSNYTSSALAQREMNAPGRSPPMCSEYYSGHLTHWGDEHMASRSAEEFVATLQAMLAQRFSVSVYMAHGGTNFGFWGGANSDGSDFQPVTTSYDFGAPVREWGAHGIDPAGVDEFERFRTVLLAHSLLPPRPVPTAPPLAAYGLIRLPWRATLWEALRSVGGEGVVAREPLAFEKVGARYGFVLYRAERVSLGGGVAEMHIGEARDRAHVFFKRRRLGVLTRGEGAQALRVHQSEWRVQAGREGGGEGVLEILVENMGRINYGHPQMWDPKGIGNVSVNGQVVAGPWTMTPVPLSHLPADALRHLGGSEGGRTAGEEWSGERGGGGRGAEVSPPPPPLAPTFFRGSLHLQAAPADTFLLTDSWGKGYVWVNGQNLGAYWPAVGPQQYLYLPACFLRQGDNDVVVLELDAADDRPDPSVLSSSTPLVRTLPAPLVDGIS